MLLAGESLEKLSDDINIVISKEHNFGTDTILLADFSMPKKYEKALEIGTGCGAIPLYWSCFEGAKYTVAVEIQKTAASMAKRSVELNGLESKIEVVNKDIKEFINIADKGTYDVVVCNPPYKAYGCGIVNEDVKKKLARHEYTCTIDDVTMAASNLLRFGGRLCVCQRMERLCDVLFSMKNKKIEPKKIRFVQQRRDSAPKFFMVEGKSGAKPGMTAMPTLFIEDEHGGDSEEIRRIYKFYRENKNGR